MTIIGITKDEAVELLSLKEETQAEQTEQNTDLYKIKKGTLKICDIIEFKIN